MSKYYVTCGNFSFVGVADSPLAVAKKAMSRAISEDKQDQLSMFICVDEKGSKAIKGSVLLNTESVCDAIDDYQLVPKS